MRRVLIIIGSLITATAIGFAIHSLARGDYSDASAEAASALLTSLVTYITIQEEA